MRRLATVAIGPVFAGLVYFAFASTSVRKWWRDRHRKAGEAHTYP